MGENVPHPAGEVKRIFRVCHFFSAGVVMSLR